PEASADATQVPVEVRDAVGGHARLLDGLLDQFPILPVDQVEALDVERDLDCTPAESNSGLHGLTGLRRYGVPTLGESTNGDEELSNPVAEGVNDVLSELLGSDLALHYWGIEARKQQPRIKPVRVKHADLVDMALKQDPSVLLGDDCASPDEICSVTDHED